MKLRLTFKLPAMIVVGAVLTAALVATNDYFTAVKVLENQASKTLENVRNGHKAETLRFLNRLHQDLTVMAAGDQVQSAITDLSAAFRRIIRQGEDRAQFMHHVFPTHLPTGNLAATIIKDPAILDYGKAHDRHDPWFRAITPVRGYGDLYLIDDLGNVVYSVVKKDDFASDLVTGRWRGTGLAKVFNAVMSKSDLGARYDLKLAHSLNGARAHGLFEDISDYLPDPGEGAGFLAVPVIDSKGKIFGALAIRFPTGRLNTIMQESANLGRTGQAYLVGQDMLFRSQPRFEDRNFVVQEKVDNEAVRAAISGEQGVVRTKSYNGTPVMAAYGTIKFHGVAWAIISEMEEQEILLPAAEMRKQMFAIGGFLTLLLVLVGLMLSRSVTVPLSRLSQAIDDFARSRQAVDLADVERPDEIGDIARGFQSAAQEVSLHIAEIEKARSELKRGETVLRESEERIRSLLEVSPIGFALTRPGGEILLVNNALKSMLGLAKETSTLSDMGSYYCDPGAREGYVEKLKREGRVYGFETQWKRSDGTDFWVTLTSRLIDFDGDKAIMAWASDIDEQKTAGDELARSSAKLETALESMSDGMFMLDADLNYVMSNQRYVEFLQIPATMVAEGQPVENVVRHLAERGDYGKVDIEEFTNSRVKQLGSGGSSTVELTMPDGRVVEFRSAPTQTGGTVVRLTDVSVRKQTEAEIEAAHRMMSDSIQYASRIQRSLLPDGGLMADLFADHFCLWEPRDVVGGDMYWVRKDRRGYFVALFDCTGHGVPGALMTTIAVSALNVAFAETGDPCRLVARVNQIVKEALGQTEESGLSDDGLEMGICLIEPERMRLTYAGARFELLSAVGDKIEVIKGDKGGLGYRHVPYDQRFNNKSLRLLPGQRFYLYSDGITDQVGGNKRRAFGRKRLIRTLVDVAHLNMSKQGELVTNAILAYQGAEPRRDDVSMIGFMPVR